MNLVLPLRGVGRLGDIPSVHCLTVRRLNLRQWLAEPGQECVCSGCHVVGEGGVYVFHLLRSCSAQVFPTYFVVRDLIRSYF